MELNINAAQNFYKGANQVDKLYLKGQLIYPTYTLEYFNITPKRNDQISFSGSDLQYSFDKVNWNNVSGAISVSRGQKVYFKGNCTPQQNSGIGSFYSTSARGFDVSGNIMSLLFGDNFIGQTSLVGYDYAFSSLFAQSYVVDCSKLILPATILSSQCYRYMFSGCSSLTTAPELPATILAGSCYAGMFENCTSLTTAPALQATTFTDYNGNVAYDVYKGMFGGCSSLATAPALPATTISGGCYESMFQGCSSLTTAPALPATTLAWNCYAYMFNNCTSLVNAPQLPTMTLCNRCYEGMFRYCTSLTTAPALPATIVGVSCYAYMFESCTSLVNAPSLPALELKGPYNDVANDCYRNMFYNCTSLVTPPSLPATSLAGSCYCNMFKGCTSLTSVPTIAATTLTDMNGNPTWWDFSGMFSGCTSLTTVPTNYLPASNVFNGCYSWMFENCTSLTQVPDLPANRVWDEGYEDMFVGCTSLVNAPSISATFMAQSACKEMFSGCTSLVNAPSTIALTSAPNWCCQRMFQGCTALTTAPSLPATSLGQQSYGGMFMECTALTTAPDLPATSFGNWVYNDMFNGCAALTTAPSILPATTLTEGCYMGMFSRCTALTTAPNLPATTLADSCYQNMFYGCSSLNYIKCSATNISSTDCTDDWVNGVANSGTFVKHPDMNDWTTGISGIPVGWAVEDFDIYSTEYFTIEPLENGTLTFSKGYQATGSLKYSTDHTTWTTLTSGTPINITQGQNVYIKGNISPVDPYGTGSFVSSNNINVSGNIMSLLYEDNFIGKKSLSNKEAAFTALFTNASHLINANNLVLPATVLSIRCYSAMFDGCTSLISVPKKLPATTLTQQCYNSMFSGCTSLTSVRTNYLPATTLANYCYASMFSDCTSLTTAPELPATTLTDSCYSSMFQGCSSLEYIKCLATDISATSCTNGWVNGVANSGTFVEHPNNYDWTRGANGIPYGWDVEDIDLYSKMYTTIEMLESGQLNASRTGMYYSINDGLTWDELTTSWTSTFTSGTKILLKRSTNVTSECVINANGKFKIYGNSMSLQYGDDFVGKTVFPYSNSTFYHLFYNNKYIVDAYNFILPSLTLSANCYNFMFGGCSNLKFAPKELPATTLGYRCYSSIFDGTKIVNPPRMAGETQQLILQGECYRGMFYGVKTLTSAPKLPNLTLANGCYYDMFNGCTALTTAPELPATTLANNCYQNMFRGCSSLNYIKCLATNISASSCTSNWVNGVANSGTFVEHPDMNDWTTGTSGIPLNWTVIDYSA